MKGFSVFCGNSNMFNNDSLKHISDVIYDNAVMAYDLEKGDYFENKRLIVGFCGTIYSFHNSEKNNAEIIAGIYQEKGKNFLNEFEGSFILFIIDKFKYTVLCARDHFGSAPLFYLNYKGNLFFSSSLSKVANSNIIKKEISIVGLSDYFTLNHIPAPCTIFNGIFALRPGEYLEYDLKNQSFDTEIYWDIDPSINKMVHNHDVCKSELRNALIESVEKRTIHEKNGVFLSGGIDSTVIAGIASKVLNKSIDTFTLGFKEQAYDESNRASIAAEAFGTNHHLYILDYDDALCELNKIINGFDQPFADASAIPTWMVNKFAASSGITNILTGDGSDQIFSGSSKYLIGYYVNKYKSIPKIIRIPFEKILYMIPDKTSMTRKVRKVISCTEMTTIEMRKRMLQLGLPESDITKLLFSVPDRINDTVDRYYNIHCNDTDELTNTLYVDLKVVADSCMMTKMGSMSRMAGVRTHFPMMSKNVLNCAFSIPSEFKQINSSGKVILKEAFKDLIPSELLTASKKGFDPPIAEWFRGPLESDLRSVLNKEDINKTGLLNYNYILQLINEHKTCIIDRSSVLWSVYVFQKWYNREFNRDK